MTRKTDPQSEKICDETCKKSKLELILDFARDVLRYFDKNKLEACIFWAGVSFIFATWALARYAEDINKIMSSITR